MCMLGRPIKGSRKEAGAPVTIYFPLLELDDIRDYARVQGVTMREIVREGVRDYLNARRKESGLTPLEPAEVREFKAGMVPPVVEKKEYKPPMGGW